jgi:hypothetical protein
LDRKVPSEVKIVLMGNGNVLGAVFVVFGQFFIDIEVS